MSSNNSTAAARNELTKYAQQIENLAHQVQDAIANGNDPLFLANEMVRNSSTFVFALGGFCAMQQKKTGGNVKVAGKKNPNQARANYYNVRDHNGRFAKV